MALLVAEDFDRQIRAWHAAESRAVQAEARLRVPRADSDPFFATAMQEAARLRRVADALLAELSR